MHSTATVSVEISFFWTDPRMIGYDHHVLPTTLWGPRLEMQDVVDGKCTETQQNKLKIHKLNVRQIELHSEKNLQGILSSEVRF